MGFTILIGLIKPPFVTVPRTGSIGVSNVQEYPCGASSDNLLLIPKDGTSIEYLYVAAAIIRKEKWRFNYGAKITPSRIDGFPIILEQKLIDRISKK